MRLAVTVLAAAAFTTLSCRVGNCINCCAACPDQPTSAPGINITTPNTNAIKGTFPCNNAGDCNFSCVLENCTLSCTNKNCTTNYTQGDYRFDCFNGNCTWNYLDVESVKGEFPCTNEGDYSATGNFACANSTGNCTYVCTHGTCSLACTANCTTNYTLPDYSFKCFDGNCTSTFSGEGRCGFSCNEDNCTVECTPNCTANYRQDNYVFTCRNGNCTWEILEQNAVNGHFDCDNAGTCTYQCENGNCTIDCTNGHCIANYRIGDFVFQCLDGNCTWRDLVGMIDNDLEYGNFLCTNGGQCTFFCIEDNCTTICTNNNCIANYTQGDYRFTCSGRCLFNKEDFAQGEFSCEDNGICAYLCNDGSCTFNCTNNNCTANHKLENYVFLCLDGNCYYRYMTDDNNFAQGEFKCNDAKIAGDFDCINDGNCTFSCNDGNCTVHCSTTNCTANYTTFDYSFTCLDSNCVSTYTPRQARCDFFCIDDRCIFNCTESNCTTNYTAGSYAFQCLDGNCTWRLEDPNFSTGAFNCANGGNCTFMCDDGECETTCNTKNCTADHEQDNYVIHCVGGNCESRYIGNDTIAGAFNCLREGNCTFDCKDGNCTFNCTDDNCTAHTTKGAYWINCIDGICTWSYTEGNYTKNCTQNGICTITDINRSNFTGNYTEGNYTVVCVQGNCTWYYTGTGPVVEGPSNTTAPTNVTAGVCPAAGDNVGCSQCHFGAHYDPITCGCVANPCQPTSVPHSNYTRSGSLRGSTNDKVAVACAPGFNALNNTTTTAICQPNGYFTPVICKGRVVWFTVVTNAGSCSQDNTNITNNITHPIVNITNPNITNPNITIVNTTNTTQTRRQLDANTDSEETQNAIQDALSRHYGTPVTVEEFHEPNSTCVNNNLMVTSFFATEVPRRDNEAILPQDLPVSLPNLPNPNQTVVLRPVGEINNFWVAATVKGVELPECPNNTTELFTQEAKQAFAEHIQSDMNAVPVAIFADTKCEGKHLISNMTAIVSPLGTASPNTTNMTFPANRWWPTQSAAVAALPIVVGQQAIGQLCNNDGDCASAGRRAGVSCKNNRCVAGGGPPVASSCCAALNCEHHRIRKCETSNNGQQCKCKFNAGGIAMIVILTVLGGLCLLGLLAYLCLNFLRGGKRERVEDPALRAPHLERVSA